MNREIELLSQSLTGMATQLGRMVENVAFVKDGFVRVIDPDYLISLLGEAARQLSALDNECQLSMETIAEERIRVERAEAALQKAANELDEAADKFWVIHCNHPGAAVGRGQEQDKAFCKVMYERMTASRNAARAALPATEAK